MLIKTNFKRGRWWFEGEALAKFKSLFYQDKTWTVGRALKHVTTSKENVYIFSQVICRVLHHHKCIKPQQTLVSSCLAAVFEKVAYSQLLTVCTLKMFAYTT